MQKKKRFSIDRSKTTSLWPNLGVGVFEVSGRYSLQVVTPNTIFLLTGLRIYTGEYKAQGSTLCPTEGRALRGPRALDSPVEAS